MSDPKREIVRQNWEGLKQFFRRSSIFVKGPILSLFCGYNSADKRLLLY